MAGTKFGDSSDPAFEDALLAAAAVAAPPVAAASAIIETGKDAVEFAKDAAGEVTGAFEDLFGGGDDVPPGTSTFPVDPDAPTYTPEEYAAQREAKIEAQQAAADAAERQADVAEAKAGKVQDANAEAGGIYQDPRYEDVSDHAAHTQVDDTLDLESGIAGAGASAGAVGAPDGAYEPVSASEPHSGIGFIPEGADVGAPDDVFEPVSESALHTSVAGVDAGAPDGVFEPVSDSALHTSVAGVDAGAPDGVFEPVSDSEPHTTVAGADAGAPDGVFEPVSDSDLHTSVAGADAGAPDGVFGPVSDSDLHTSVAGADAGAPDGVFEPVSDSDLHTTVGFVPVADDLPTVDGVQTEVPFGSDVQLNPQPIPPGMGADIGEPVTEAAASAAPDVADSSIIIVGGTEAAFGNDGGAGTEVSLNPQPIPPGMGADIGEPVADVAAAEPSTTDSSIIIVGGTEAPVFSDVATASAEAPVVADIEVAEVPMEDVASTIAVDDGPLFGAAVDMQAPIEEQVLADDGLDG